MKPLDGPDVRYSCRLLHGRDQRDPPFRDGNGRTQREFIRELAVHAGFVIDWSRVTREQMTAASLKSFQTGDSSEMAALITLSMK